MSTTRQPPALSAPAPEDYGDHLVFVDESGDHGLAQCDPEYPVFVLAFCIMRKSDYTGTICPALQRFKFTHFGHDFTILHEHEIRKSKNAFAFLQNKTRREPFFADLNALMESTPMTLVGVVIHKERLKAKYNDPVNPYNLGLHYGLERIAWHLKEIGQAGKITPVVCECRGKKEDDELELEFRRLAAAMPGFEIRFMDKKANLPGLQIADLVARPIGRHAMNPQQENRAFDILKSKFRKSGSGNIYGYGLKIFP